MSILDQIQPSHFIKFPVLISTSSGVDWVDLARLVVVVLPVCWCDGSIVVIPFINCSINHAQ